MTMEPPICLPSSTQTWLAGKLPQAGSFSQATFGSRARLDSSQSWKTSPAAPGWRNLTAGVGKKTPAETHRCLSWFCMVFIVVLSYFISAGWWLGGFNPSERYEFVNWDDEIPNIWEHNKCSKPPTRAVDFWSHADIARSGTNWAMVTDPAFPCKNSIPVSPLVVEHIAIENGHFGRWFTYASHGDCLTWWFATSRCWTWNRRLLPSGISSKHMVI